MATAMKKSGGMLVDIFPDRGDENVEFMGEKGSIRGLTLPLGPVLGLEEGLI